MAIRTANNQSLTEITAIPSGISLGGSVLLQTITADDEASVSFTSGIDSTYKEYIFKFIDMHPEDSHTADFAFNLSIDTGSNYNVTKTTTAFYTGQFETGTGYADVSYETTYDLTQSTAVQFLGADLGGESDESSCGTFHLYDPSSTTLVKHFMSSYQRYIGAPATFRDFVAGYGNTTSAVDAIQFTMSGENFSGTIKMYGACAT